MGPGPGPYAGGASGAAPRWCFLIYTLNSNQKWNRPRNGRKRIVFRKFFEKIEALDPNINILISKYAPECEKYRKRGPKKKILIWDPLYIFLLFNLVWNAAAFASCSKWFLAKLWYSELSGFAHIYKKSWVSGYKTDSIAWKLGKQIGRGGNPLWW